MHTERGGESDEILTMYDNDDVGTRYVNIYLNGEFLWDFEIKGELGEAEQSYISKAKDELCNVFDLDVYSYFTNRGQLTYEVMDWHGSEDY